MYISENDWKNYIKKLSALNRKAGQLMEQWIQKNGLNDRKALIDYAYAVAAKYSEGSAALTAQMYDAIAELSGKDYEAAEMAELPSYGEVAKTINGTLKHSQNADLVANSVSRLVKRTGADTMLNNAERDGAQFAWVPSGDSCAFCITLASRGWQYMSKNALRNGHAEHIHANCDCEYVVRFDNNSGVEGYDPQIYEDMYYRAEGNTPQERINSLRRMHYEQNKELIRAQKRNVYAENERAEIIKGITENGLKIANSDNENGIINIEIDELVPCLRDMRTGELVDTTIGVVANRSDLKGYNKNTGWYINWQRIPDDYSILALRVKGQDEIQGLVAFRGRPENKTVEGYWAVVNPKSNKQKTASPEYSGIGGHLFAAMADVSRQMGFGGFVEGTAANSKLLQHYVENLGATQIGGLRFFIDDVAASELIEKYNWDGL